MVTVDKHFVRCGEKAFAIRSISSVEIREQRLASGCLPWVVGSLMCIIVFISGISFFAAIDPEAPVSPGVWLFIVLMLVASIYLVLETIKVVRRSRTTAYSVILATTAGEREAFVSTSPERAYELQRLIEAAIANEL